MPDIAATWSFLPWGYALTVLVELPVLLIGLSPRHSLRRRIVAGFALTACTYPIVVIVLPPLVWTPFGRGWYLLVAEIFAPLAECLLFRAAYGQAPHLVYRGRMAVHLRGQLTADRTAGCRRCWQRFPAGQIQFPQPGQVATLAMQQQVLM